MRSILLIDCNRKGLTLALRTLSEDTIPPADPSQIPEVKDPENPPLHSIELPGEIIGYVDSSRNPDIYTREFVEVVQRQNQDLKGKSEAFADFRDILAKEIVAALPELKGEVERTLEAVGEGPIKDPDAVPMSTNAGAQEVSTQSGQDRSNGLVNAQGS